MCTGNIIRAQILINVSAVYPCVYREHILITHHSENNYGLSLCVQGTSVRAYPELLYLRFIPVCTGNIHSDNLPFASNAVYPCVYREHLHIVIPELERDGLSLCVQGTYNWLFAQLVYIRFIPVCTGNIIVDVAQNFQQAVYPCVYREHGEVLLDIHEARGLSLCVQGTWDKHIRFNSGPRFIPVCTGNI